jgi:hypothetical protein
MSPAGDNREDGLVEGPVDAEARPDTAAMMAAAAAAITKGVLEPEPHRRQCRGALTRDPREELA